MSDEEMQLSLLSGITAEWRAGDSLRLYDPYDGIAFNLNKDEWRTLYDKMTEKIEAMGA
jgi:hypothetical protein